MRCPTRSSCRDGAIDQFWFRQDRPGPIFLMNAESVEAARAIIDQMPIVAQGSAAYDSSWSARRSG